MSTAVLDSDIKENLDLNLDANEGDHDKFSHYVKKEDILNAAVDGKKVMALCGKMWTPVSDPARFSICPNCKDIYDNVVGTGSNAPS